MMSQNLQQTFLNEMEYPLMSSREASRAKISALLESKSELMVSEVDYGLNVLVLLATYDPISQSLKTSQIYLPGQIQAAHGLAEYSETWPASGIMLSGIIYQLPILGPGIGGEESGYLPTPTKLSDSKGAPKNRYYGSGTCMSNLREVLRNGPDDPIYPHPSFVELVMGYPIGHTELAP